MRPHNYLAATITALAFLTGVAEAHEERDRGPEDRNTRACHKISYEGLGAMPSRKEALPFAAELFTSHETSQRVVAIHPSGKELFFTRIGPPIPRIMRSVFENGRWQEPTVASFSDVGVNLEPSISPDGRTLYFVSTRPPSKGTDIWKVERTRDGWGTPTRLSDAINTDAYEFHPQVDAAGDLYFATDGRTDSYGDADLYVSKFENGEYLPAQNLGPQINTAAREWDAYVSPDDSYMLFKSNRPGGYGGMDIYISEHKRGTWTTPRNAGPAVNTELDDDTGDVTPDGRFLIFARSQPGAEFWDMYWIDLRAILHRNRRN